MTRGKYDWPEVGLTLWPCYYGHSWCMAAHAIWIWTAAVVSSYQDTGLSSPSMQKSSLSPSSCAHSIVLLIHSLMLQILSGQSRLSTMLGTGDEMVIALSFFELFPFKVCPILGECSYVMLWGGWAQGGPAMPGKGTCWMFQILSQSQWYVCLSL